MSRRYAIGSIDEAQGYIAHPALGSRYWECVRTLQDLIGTTAEKAVGSVDAVKLRPSLSLFEEAAPGDPFFAAALHRWFGGHKDRRTVAIAKAAFRLLANLTHVWTALRWQVRAFT